MDNTLRDLKPYRRWCDGLIVCALALPSLTFGGLWVSLHSNILHIYPDYHFNYILGLVFGDNGFGSYFSYLAKTPLRSILFWLIPTVGLFAGLSLTVSELKLREPFVHLRGRQFLTGKAALKSASAASRKMLNEGRKGIEILPNIFLSREKELQSILVVGAQGGGKTVFINTILKQLIARNDKLIVYDLVKSDYTCWLPNCVILSVTDSRSFEWQLGTDITSLAAASTFASSIIIGNDKDPIWSNSAQSILIALILKLQDEQGLNWSWLELNDQLYQDLETIKTICDQYYPPASGAVADLESKTTQSILINLHSFCSPIYRLAQTWAAVDKRRRISLKNWLDSDKSKLRNIIIHGDKTDSVLSSALARAITNVCTNHIASLAFSESKRRKLWFVLDELPQAGKLETISTLMEIGRSKGVSAIFGFQDIAQIRQIYGKDEDAKWLALFGLRVFPKIQGSQSQDWVCEQIGEREVQMLSKNINQNANGTSISLSQQRLEVPVILPSQTETEFGKDKAGINALVLGLGENALKLHFTFPAINQVRKGFVPWPPKNKKNQNQSIKNKTSQVQIQMQNEAQNGLINLNTLFDQLMPEPKQHEQRQEVIILDNNEPLRPAEKEAKIEDESIKEATEPHVIETFASAIGIDHHLIDVANIALEITVKNSNTNQPHTIKPYQPARRKRQSEREA